MILLRRWNGCGAVGLYLALEGLELVDLTPHPASL